MAGGTGGDAGMTWLTFALLTVLTWGIYGVFLHNGQSAMGDPINGRYRAFLFVGVAYFLTAVLAPLAMLWMRGASFSAFPGLGIAWSLLAGTVGAIGAFGVLLAFGAKGSPAVVMSIVFAGAPIVNAFTAIAFHPPAGGLRSLSWQFLLGIALAAVGGFLVTRYKPDSPPPPPAATATRIAGGVAD